MSYANTKQHMDPFHKAVMNTRIKSMLSWTLISILEIQSGDIFHMLYDIVTVLASKKMWHAWPDLLTIFYARVVLIKWVRISSLYTIQQPTVTQRTTLINSLRPSDVYICIGKLTIIGSDNGLSPDRRQAIIWTNAGLLLIGPLGTNFSEILIKILTFSFKKMRLKVSSAKWRPFCLGLNVLRDKNRKCVKAKHDILLRVASGSLIKTSM